MKLPGGRTRTLVGGIISVLVVAMILSFARGTADSERISVPTTVDSDAQGLEALYRWLNAMDVPVTSLREPLTSLADAESGEPGLLVMSWPGIKPVSSDGALALSSWIADGNSLLLLTTAFDQPMWARRIDADYDELDTALSLNFDHNDDIVLFNTDQDAHDDESLTAVDRRYPLALHPGPGATLFTDVTSVTTRGYRQSTETRYLTTNSGELVPLLQTRDGGHTALSYKRHGHGQLWISHFPELLSNAVLARDDNWQLAAGIINASVGSGGSVLFDDFRFGLSNLYDGKAFYRDKRLHTTIIALGILWLLWLVGRNPRLAPVKLPRVRPSLARLINATGGLYARNLSELEAGRALLGHFDRQTRRDFAIAADTSLWAGLTEQLGTSHPAIEQLRGLAEKLNTGTKQPLGAITQLVNDIRKDLYRK